MNERRSSVAWRLNAERLVLLGWSRAILLQLAHPLVAQGVADHSSFRAGRLSAALRLHHTVRAMLSLTFGTEAQRAAAIAGINGIHRRVHGVLRAPAGIFPAGTRYSAEDPDLLLWVHATLLDSIPLVYDRFVSPLTDAERDAYCAEAAPVVRALGVPDAHPPMTWESAQSYLTATLASGRIVVSETARELARSVLAPPFAVLVAPGAHVNRVVTLGLLPPAIREQYGFAWSERHERALARWTRIIRRSRRWLPDRLALWPEARRG